MVFLEKDLWEDYFKGYLITGCAIRNKSLLYFCLRQDTPSNELVSMWDSDLPTRLVMIDLDDYDDKIAGSDFDGMNMPSLGVARKPKEQALLLSADIDGYVFVVGSGEWPPEYVDKGAYAVSKLKCVLNHAYAIGVGRNIYKRRNIGQWDKFDKGIEEKDSLAFSDIDAFTESDMYAVGGDGEVWLYDGDNWSQCGFPSNEQLNTVVCAPDGYVYIGGESGNIWRGLNNTWEKIYAGDSSILWNEMRWFQDKLWVISDYYLRILKNNELVYPEDELGNEIILRGHMDVYDDMVVIADLDHAYTFDGKKLRTIVAPYE